MELRDVCAGQDYLFVHNLDNPVPRPEGRRDRHTGTVVTVLEVPKRGQAGLIPVNLQSTGTPGYVWASELSEITDED